jgi:hypothetical protein
MIFPLSFIPAMRLLFKFGYSCLECFCFFVPTYERIQIFNYQDIQIERGYEELLRGPPR